MTLNRFTPHLVRALIALAALALPAAGAIAQQNEPAPAEAGAPSTVNPVSSSGTENVSPSSASAPYQFQSEGIFGCSQVAGATMSVGTLSAIGSTYVPVNDAAVTLNSGTLLYKECVLRPLVDRQREAALAALLKRAQIAIETGRDGEPLYVRNQAKELLDISDREFEAFMNNGSLDSINPAFRREVAQSLQTNYVQQTRNPESGLNCPYEGDLRAVFKGQTTDIWGALTALQYPQCNPLGAYFLAQDQLGSRISQAQEYQINEWTWGEGFYDVHSGGSGSTISQQTYTPASIVRSSYQQLLSSPVRQLESANDIGQMINALYAGITTQVISDNRGLYGLTQPVGTQPSYIEQVARETSAGVRGAAVSTALNILYSARQVEISYLQAVSSIVNVLMQTATQLRAAENQCWALVVPAAQSYASQSGFSINVATSTVFSQRVIDTNIVPLATVAARNSDASKSALQKIDQLIASLTNTASLDAQRLALQQLDSLVAQRALHTSYDVTAMQKTLQDIRGSMTDIVQNTVKDWANSTDPSVGWCNTQNPTVPQMWATQWKTS